MELPNTYTLDTETLKVNAYRLICLFYANKEISRTSDPDHPDTGVAKLERKYFAREMTYLLLSIAMAARVVDDQMKALPAEDPQKDAYLSRRDEVDRLHSCMMFDELSLREVCNKIIHATVVEPHSQKGYESHQIDEYNWAGWSEVSDQSPEEAGAEPDQIEWNYLSGNIRLGGQHHGKQWWYLLQVPEFVEAITDLYL